MSTIATLSVKLIADSAGFVNAMDNAEKKTQSWSSRVSASMKTAGGAITGFGQKATTFLTLPLMAAGMAAVNYASDLEETKNKVIVVFGEMSDSVLTWSQNSAMAMGMSQNTALSAAGTFGNLFTTMGLGAADSADMSMGLVQLAADLASFNNLDPTDVLDKLRSGLVGEVEPLRTLGINLSQATVAAKAMEMGLADENGELSQSALAQARYALILEQSKNAAGDFARTSDGLANQQRILKAQFEDAAAALGQKLLPYALKFVQWVSNLISKFQALTPEQQKWVLIIAAVAAAIGPVLMVIGTLISAIGAIIGVIGAITAPVLIVIAVIAALVAIGYLLYLAWTNNWGGIQEKVAAVWAMLQPIFASIANWLSVNIPLAIAWLSNMWTTVLLPAIQAVWMWMSTVLFPFFQALGEFFMAVFSLAIRVVAGVWQNILWPAIKKVANWMQANLIPVVEEVVKFFAEKFKPAIDGITRAIQAVTSAIRKMIDWLNNIELPDWLQPGSPTPFETGLWGILKALKAIDKFQAPELFGSQPLAPAYAGSSAIKPTGQGLRSVTIQNYGSIVFQGEENGFKSSALNELI